MLIVPPTEAEAEACGRCLSELAAGPSWPDLELDFALPASMSSSSSSVFWSSCLVGPVPVDERPPLALSRPWAPVEAELVGPWRAPLVEAGSSSRGRLL